jgi:uncharacterized protein YbaP (TraB family)
MLKKMRWALPALSLLAACASASPPAPKVAPAHPALWKLSDEDTTIYLFGTIHVLREGYQWRTPVFDKATGEAQELVLEVADLDDRAKTASTFLSLAVTPDLPPVIERVPAAKRAGLQALIDKSGVPAAALNRFESWAVAITLAAGMLKNLDVSPEYGVEKALQAIFVAGEKPVSGLETSEQQLGFFDKLPEAAQRTFLASMVDDSVDPAKEFDDMVSAWSKGDDKAIALSFDDELKLSPELVEMLLRRRNANWTTLLKKRLEKPGTILVAVGAGHLAGPDSVIAMLGKDKLKVVRVQ